jgi:hypothetical protein
VAVAGMVGAVGNLWIKKAGCWQRAVRIRSWVATEAITQSGNFSRLAWLHENAVATERAIVFQPWWSSIMYKSGHEEICNRTEHSSQVRELARNLTQAIPKVRKT